MKENRFYVYAYLDPRKPGKYKYGEFEFDYEPFYIGKGKYQRHKQHLKEKKNNTSNILKFNIINKIRKATKKEPIIIKIKTKLSEKDAYKLEEKLIKTIGNRFHNMKKGPLANKHIVPNKFSFPYLKFKNAKKYVQALNIKTRKEWFVYWKTNIRPYNIPLSPRDVYKEEWSGWGDWLGTNNIASFKREFLPFEKARDYARGLKLNSLNEWRFFCNSEDMPLNIPKQPNVTYKNKGWTNFPDWLGNKNKSKNIIILEFEEARKAVRNMKIKTVNEWYELCRLKKIPINIPHAPHKYYKNEGWKGFPDWLGNNNNSKNTDWVNFTEAKKYVKSLNIKTQREWWFFCKNGLREKSVPSSPHKFYKEWKSWSDFIN